MAQSSFGVGQTGKGKREKDEVTTKSKQTAATTTVEAKRRPKGVVMARRYSTPGTDPLDEITYERRSSIITNPDGSIVFKMEGAEIPAEWSQLATDIVISKYFRKAGLHGDKSKGEKSVREVVTRIAKTIRDTGESFGGYFATKADADTFEAELSFLLANQYGAFNSPVWFNCGLFHAYGIEGSGGNWAWDMNEKGATNVTETPTPTAVRSVRPASSSRSTTTS